MFALDAGQVGVVGEYGRYMIVFDFNVGNGRVRMNR
jgi:hypothetical protein